MLEKFLFQEKDLRSQNLIVRQKVWKYNESKVAKHTIKKTWKGKLKRSSRGTESEYNRNMYKEEYGREIKEYKNQIKPIPWKSFDTFLQNYDR